MDDRARPNRNEEKTEKPDPVEHRLREAILQAVSFAAERFLRMSPWYAGIKDILEKLGLAAEVSRVYIFKNHSGEDGELLTSQMYEWVATDVQPQGYNPDCLSFPWLAGGMGRWVDIMSRGGVIQGLPKDFPQSERAVLLPQGIHSIVAVPIFVWDSWWGFIGFDECSMEREWSNTELNALRTAANMIGAAIQLDDSQAKLRQSERRFDDLCISENISERKRAEKALRQSEARYRAIVEDQTELISRFTPEGRLTFVNAAYCRYFDEMEEELIGNGFWHHLPAEDQRRFKEHLELLNLQNEVAIIEHRVYSSTDEIRWLQWTDRAIFNEYGKIIEYQGVGRDVTERRKAEEALHQALNISQQRHAEISALLEASRSLLRHRELQDAASSIFLSCKRLIGAKSGFVDLMSKDGRFNENIIMDLGGYDCILDPSLPVPVRGLREKAYLSGRTQYDNNFSQSRWAALLPEGHLELKNVLLAPLILNEKVVGLIGLGDKPTDFTEHDARMASAFAELASIAFLSSQTYDALRESEKQLRYLSAQILNAQEKERQRIARDLHDSIIQSLATIKVNLRVNLKQLSGEISANSRDSFAAVISMIQNTIDEVRRVYTDLRPSMLDNLGILATMSWACQEFEETHRGVRAQTHADIEEDEIPDTLKIVIYRIMQEALNNIAKHSKATLVEVSLSKNDSTIALHIRDNGCGFDINTVLSNQTGNTGLGLVSMKERTELSGGVFAVRSSKWCGTSIHSSWDHNKLEYR
jgi:PAS domain S-box-containing protein